MESLEERYGANSSEIKSKLELEVKNLKPEFDNVEKFFIELECHFERCTPFGLFTTDREKIDLVKSAFQ